MSEQFCQLPPQENTGKFKMIELDLYCCCCKSELNDQKHFCLDSIGRVFCITCFCNSMKPGNRAFKRGMPTGPIHKLSDKYYRKMKEF